MSAVFTVCVANGVFSLLVQQIWACNLCKKKQEILVKTGQWYHGGMAKPVQLDVDTGSDTSSIRADPSPPHEKKPKFYERPMMGESEERMVQEGMHGGGPLSPGIGPRMGPGEMHGPPGGKHPGLQRTGSSLKELKRQFSMSEVNKENNRHAHPGDLGTRGRPGEQRGGLHMDREHSRGRGDMEGYPPHLPPDGMDRGRPPLYEGGLDSRDPYGEEQRRLSGERRPDMIPGGEMHPDMLGEDRLRGLPQNMYPSHEAGLRREDCRPR